MNGAARQAGLSLVELMFTVVAAVALLCTTIQLGRSSRMLTSSTLARGHLVMAAEQALLRSGRDLRWAQPTTLLITTENGSDRADFVVCTAFDGDEPQWSTPITLRVEPISGDANRNGAADEGQLVRIQDGETMVLCRNVTKGGFSLKRDDFLLEAEVTLFVVLNGVVVERVVRHCETLINRE